MSFFEDMLIYNATHKKMTAEGTRNYSVSCGISFTPTTEYQAIAEFTPNLSGSVLISFQHELNNRSTKLTDCRYGVFDSNGNCIYEREWGHSASTLGYVPVKAFEHYIIKYKYKEDPYAFYYPTAIEMSWGVEDVNIGIANLTTPTA